MTPEIVVRHVANSSLAGHEDRFGKDVVTIGRGDASDVAFDPQRDSIVSHRHAELTVDGARLMLRDVGSRNGTYVNQRRITDAVEVGPDDTIALGPDGPLIQVYLETGDDPTRAAPAGAGPGAAPTVGVVRPDGAGSAAAAWAAASYIPESSPPPVTLPPPPPLSPKPTAAARPKPARAAAPVPAEESLSPGALMRVIDQAMYRHRRPSSLPLAILVMLLGFGGGAAFGYLYLPDLMKQWLPPPPEPAVEEIPLKAVPALGRLEPAGGVVNVAAPPGEIVATLLVKEGDTVEPEAELARFLSHDLAQRELDAAQAALKDATAQRDQSRAYGAALVAEAEKAVEATGVPLDLQVKTQEAQISFHDSVWKQTTLDKESYAKLQNPQAETLNKLTKAETTAQMQVALAQLQLEEMKQAHAVKREQAKTQLATAQANQTRLEGAVGVDLARKNVEKACAALERTVLRAPRAGRILRINTHPGEAAGPGPVLQIGDTKAFQVVAEVFEDNLKRVSKGQKAVVRSPALPADLNGAVANVSYTVRRRGINDLNPSAEQDLRVVEVRIDLEAKDTGPHADLLARLVNLEVNVLITPK